jgi:hypothetical protein
LSGADAAFDINDDGGEEETKLNAKKVRHLLTMGRFAGVPAKPQSFAAQPEDATVVPTRRARLRGYTKLWRTSAPQSVHRQVHLLEHGHVPGVVAHLRE